jgi:hypothetical protein
MGRAEEHVCFSLVRCMLLVFLSHMQLDPILFVLLLRARLLMKLSIRVLFSLTVT